MRRGRASSIGALALLAIVLPGCMAGDDGAVFGPEDSEALVDPTGSLLPVLFKAKPARGPTPLAVEFSLDVRGANDAAMAWSIDFGNGSRESSGVRLPASASHDFTEVGTHEVTATVRAGGEATRSRLVVVVLPSDAPAADPDEEVEGETIPVDEADGDDGDDEGDGEEGGVEEDDAAGEGEDEGTPAPSSSSSSSGGTTSQPSSSTSPGSPSPTSSPSSSPASPSTTTATSPSPSSTRSASTAPPPPSDNHPPQATITASRTSGAAPLDVSFTVDASDPEGRAIQWTLDVRDDGAIEASGDRGDVPRTITHRFDQPGTYTTVFQVTDGASTVTRTVTVTAT